MRRIRRIMHASDFSSASRAAFDRAVELAKANRAELIVVHVFAPVLPYAEEGYASPQTYRELIASVQTETGRRLVRPQGVLPPRVNQQQADKLR